MTSRSLIVLSAAALVASVTPALAGIPVPAPVLGAGLPGLALLGLAGGGYLLMKWRRNRS